MKVSLNLAQQFSNVDLKSIPHDDLLKRIGAQLGAVEEVTEWAPKFEGAMIVRVVECVKHQDADKLSVCRIDDGGKTTGVERGQDGLIQVVCGAPNVHADMFAVWLPPGATVPSSRETDPFVLEARPIRGVVSSGMLASASELGISDDHTGIVELSPEDSDKEPVPGEPLTNHFGLDDFVVDCENKMFTHRPDCFGNLGVARELAGISGLKFKSPDWYLNPPVYELKKDLPLEVINSAPKLVPRFMAVAMSNVMVKPSPVWLQTTLARIGIKPINNVVDVSNYVMHLTGQPLHVFDYEKIKERSNVMPGIWPRMSQKGDELTLLGGKEITLTGEEIVIATDKQAVGLAGIMGGSETEVDENTKNIIIECATFDMYSIRRTSMRYGLFTDAVTRFNKGQSPLQNDRVLFYAMKLMSELTGAVQASNVKDIGDYSKSKPAVKINEEFINTRLGAKLSKNDIARLLRNVEFEVAEEGGLTVTPPFWRMDIDDPEDIVEEIGRLYGYDKLPVELPPRSAKPTPKNRDLEFKQLLRNKLAARGANEVLTYSFVHGDLLRKTGTDPDKWAHHLRNAISPDLQYYRTSLLPSLLNKVHPNIKAQAGDDNNQFALFEIGLAHIKGHEDEDKLPVQNERLALVIAADDKTAKSKGNSAAFYHARKYLEALVNGQAVYTPLDKDEYPISSVYAKGRSAAVAVSGEILGVIGEFKPSVARALKLPAYSAGFELDLELLMAHLKSATYRPLPEFPGTSADLTLEVLANQTYTSVATMLADGLQAIAKQHGYQASIEAKDIYQAEDADTKRLTLRVDLSHPNKTLKTEEMNAVIDELATVALGINARRI